MSLIKSMRFSNKVLVVIALLLVFAYLSPYYFLGEDTHIRVHDNLDSNIVWYKLLAESGQIFAAPETALQQIINGLPRSALPSALDAIVWLYVLFPPFVAYAISQTIMRLAAFFGMFLLLRTFIIPGKRQGYFIVALGVSVCYVILPYWPSGVLSIAGLPLAAYLFLMIRRDGFQTSKSCWLVLLLIPFFSNFILTFFFFLTLVGLLFLFDWWKNKHFNTAFFLAIFSMIALYLLKNYMLIYALFSGGAATHREEFDLGHKDLPETWQLFVKNFVHGHTHALDLHGSIILPVVLISIIIAVFYRLRVRLLIQLLFLNVLFSLIYSFWYWEGMHVLKDNIDFFNEFNFGRFHLLRPFLWYMMFALALWIIWRKVKFGAVIAVILLIAQFGQLFVLTEEIKYRHVGTPTFAEFYDEALFEDIAEYIGKEKQDYRVISVALHPTIAQYNGFYTLDTYNNTIPLAYKHAFRKIIAPELEKNTALKNYFDTWGGRLYVFSAELGEAYVFKKGSQTSIKELNLNIDQFKKLGGEYVFSGVEIENAEALGLEFEKSFSTDASYWEIYVYRAE